ncbi:hypothetical protein ATANTOWER_017671 [Ataeniobius toweri]|uniref:Uncharacterized protein n=1 Tax=Ataeniobius toweri TaxID=208326 RepID=A0ABU7AFS6_9TELE|nr:hypothetical protein [Ataeniobius toweri]
MFVMSALSSVATGNATNDLTFSFNWLSKSVDSSEIFSATLFLVKLMLTKACSFSGHRSSAVFIMHVLTNSPSGSNAISLAIRYLAFIVALLTSRLCVKIDWRFLRPTSNSSILSLLRCLCKLLYFSP